jgi:segregation and condensation protein B
MSESDNQEIDNQQELSQDSQLPAFESLDEVVPVIEAVIFASGEPLSCEHIASIVDCDEALASNAVEILSARYSANAATGIELVRIGDKFQLRTKPVYSEIVRRLKEEKPKRLSVAALETLAIVAYRQPIVKSEIEAIRGVDATPTLKTLIERGIIKIVGHQSTVGNPALYGTTEDFLKLFSLGSLAELPTLREITELERDPGESDDESDDTQTQELENTSVAVNE